MIYELNIDCWVESLLWSLPLEFKLKVECEVNHLRLS